MDNYTKGEWKAESFDRDELGAWRLRANGQSIMRLSGFQTPTENKANAQLIAQAPRLYEACKEALEKSHNPVVETILMEALAQVEVK